MYHNSNMDYAFRDGNRIVYQKLAFLSLYDFEGDFNKVIKMLETKREHFSQERKYKDEYIDGTKSKTLKFDHIYLDSQPSRYDDDDSDSIVIVGERKPTDSEVVALEKDEEQRKGFRRTQYEQLKKEFENE